MEFHVLDGGTQPVLGLPRLRTFGFTVKYGKECPEHRGVDTCFVMLYPQ